MEKKILIADDDAAIQTLLKRALSSQGYAVLAAYDGWTAVETALAEEPALILLDINMPGRKGGDVLRDLRSHPRTKMIPVIFETGAVSEDEVVAGLSTGADDYLCKPFSIAELLARVDCVLRRCALNLDANPLTKLPGSGVVESFVQRLLDNERTFSVLYGDLNEFKAYNDHYGFHRGDSVIRATAAILKDVSSDGRTLVGHIGGDDFIVVTERPDVEAMCREILSRFDAVRQGFYDEADWKAGFIMVPDRRGRQRAFAPVSLAIGVVSNAARPLASIMEISAVGAEVKGVAKRAGGSAYFIDRRRGAYGEMWRPSSAGEVAA